MFCFFSSAEISSDFSIDTVPTSTGWPRSRARRISCTIDLYFSFGAAIDLVVLVVALHRHVGRDLDHVQAVDVGEFRRLGHRRAGHAGKLGIEAEIVLEGDRGERLVLVLDLHVFLGFQPLVQAFGIAAAFHHAAGELVDDDDLVVLHHVVDVAGEQLVRAQRLVHVMHQADILTSYSVPWRSRPEARSSFSMFSVPSSVRVTWRVFSSFS